MTQFIPVVPGADEQPVTGLLGFYQARGGPVALESTTGGLVELDMTGLEGQNRRLIWTDLDAWHYENLAFPPGLRLGTYRYASGTGLPIYAIAHFAPDGLKGILKGGFQKLSDVVLHSPTGRIYPVHLQADGSFTVRDADLLPPGEFINPSILTDTQQGRQAIYRRLLTETTTGIPEQHSILLAWCDPMKLPFTFVDQARTSGSALLSVPLKFETPPPNTPVAVLRGFIPYRRILPSGVSRPTLEGQQGIEMHLRFQLPPSVVSLKVDRARLFAKVSVPFRHFVVRGNADKNPIEILSSYNSTDPIRLDIMRDDLLQLDDQGGLHLDIAITDAPEGRDEIPPKWAIESLELEVVGRTPSEDTIGSR
jgi:hypothetical protein